MPNNVKQDNGGRYIVPSMNAWTTERWVAVVVLAALALLILIRMGFRGVNVLGARVSVG